MSDKSTNGNDSETDASIDAEETNETTASSSYKVLGQFSDSSGTGVLGQNTAGSGTPVGVEGAVPNTANGYGLSTPDDARIGGSLEGTGTHTLTVGGTRALELGSPGSGTRGYTAGGNVIGGYADNGVQNSAVGATVGGGGSSDTSNVPGAGSRTNTNEVTADYGTVGGGQNNRAGGWATVAGGGANTASADHSTVGGGVGNRVIKPETTVAGGVQNYVSGPKGTVGGGEFNSVVGRFGTIAGGGPSDTTDPSTKSDTKNRVTDNYGTVGGGGNNQAGDGTSGVTDATFATVSGGEKNTASGGHATVDGGEENVASGFHSTIGGGQQNTASDNGATVGGGVENTASGVAATIGGGGALLQPNKASGEGSTISGGRDNVAGGSTGSADTNSYQTVAGGVANEVTAYGATVGGGSSNQADGSYATVPGGRQNRGQADDTFAAGRRAKAKNAGAFVWADRTNADFTSSQTGTGSSPTGVNTFHVRATGGLRLVTGLDSNDDPNAGQYLSAGGSSWQTVSARAAKQDIEPVDPRAVLAGIESLDVSTWEYEANRGVRRMGPMAEEFHETFGLGTDPETIGHVDADGVAFAAIQGLSEKLGETNDRVTELKRESDQVDRLQAETEALREENRQLRERLTALEAQVGTDAAPADD